MLTKNGQGMIEYILLLAAVIGSLVLITTSDRSVFRKSLNDAVTSTTNAMVEVSDRLEGQIVSP